ncbi:D-glycero-beta-D-manno-heptose 1,7-bisphosphate 7-phosphatase [Candidatus Poribacteria bacterium]|nr:D-glycero-beta-D-manno-heptose 1,7-bisphosphate 7-phosphatase [Candidatus Poribacteria bacterium]
MKTIFLDRDGVINRNPPDWGYVRTWEEFDFIPNALKALRALTGNGYRVIVVTNQAGIGRGLFSETNLKDIHSRMVVDIRNAGGSIDSIYYCPHHPEAGCECRKPKPGMLICAAREHNIELPNAYLIGDSTTDIEAGQRAGASTFLVLTGHGKKSYQNYIKATPFQRSDTDALGNRSRRTGDEGLARSSKYRPEKIFTNLYAATRWLLKNDT